MVLIALISNEDADIFKELYNFLKNSWNIRLQKISFGLELVNIKAIQTEYSKEENIIIIPCLFHLTQALQRKASTLGLKKISNKMCFIQFGIIVIY